jgi:peptide/nickel transport system ATP-binding protein
MSEPELLAAHGVTKTYQVSGGLFSPRHLITAVDGVSFAIDPGEIFAVIGESGSGKSTLSRLLVGLERPTSGYIEFRGRRLEEELKEVRRRVQIVFQDPYSSLDPRLRIGQSIREPLHALRYVGDFDRRVEEVLDAVALPKGAAAKMPHEFSGGQLQRIAIARALAPQPAVLVADEPVSALDVSVQAQVLNLLLDLREHEGLTIVLVAHDLGVVSRVADRVAVMFGGHIVEMGDVDDIVANPGHPYTRRLLGSVLRMDGGLPMDDGTQDVDTFEGHRPDLCPYLARCPIRLPLCASVAPDLRAAASGASEGWHSEHRTACHAVQ